MWRATLFAAILVWGLWFGGLVTLFISVQAMFAQERAVAMQAAPMLFSAFETYQFILAAAGVLVFGGLAWMGRSPWTLVLLMLMLTVVVLALVSGLVITPRLESLRLAGEGGGEDFRRLHGWSMMVYSAQTALLLAAGVPLPWMMGRTDRARSIS